MKEQKCDANVDSFEWSRFIICQNYLEDESSLWMLAVYLMQQLENNIFVRIRGYMGFIIVGRTCDKKNLGRRICQHEASTF